MPLSAEDLLAGSALTHDVIVPANTYIATWLAVSCEQANPVPVEPGRDSFNIDADLMRSAITARTKAIIPVHLFGHPCDMDKIRSLADEFGLTIIDDAAQAHGRISPELVSTAGS